MQTLEKRQKIIWVEKKASLAQENLRASGKMAVNNLQLPDFHVQTLHLRVVFITVSCNALDKEKKPQPEIASKHSLSPGTSCKGTAREQIHNFNRKKQWLCNPFTMQREIIAKDASCLGKFQSNSGKQWMHNEIFLTLDFSTGATLLLQPGFLQKQGFGCYAPWGDTGLLPRSSDSAGWLQGQFDSSVKNTVGVPRRRAVEIVHGTSSVWRKACAVNSHFTHPENPRGTDISKLPPRRVRSLTKACRNTRRARRPLCPTGAAECHASQWPGLAGRRDRTLTAILPR